MDMEFNPGVSNEDPLMKGHLLVNVGRVKGGKKSSVETPRAES